MTVAEFSFAELPGHGTADGFRDRRAPATRLRALERLKEIRMNQGLLR